MKETVNQVPHVTSSNISLNGDIATIRVNVPANLSDEEVMAVEKEAYQKLSFAMPRYTVKVTASRK
jgi:hypothetical protein